MNNKIHYNIATAVLFFFSCATVFTIIKSPAPEKTDNTTTPALNPTETDLEKDFYEWARNFAQVMHLVKDKHFKVNKEGIGSIESAMTKAIDNFLHNLDPHSNFLNQKTYKMIFESTLGKFSGRIGIIIANTRSTQDNYLTIIDTIPGSPADQAGLEPMDKIVAIGDDGKTLGGMTTEEAISLLQGECDTKVHIKVMRADQEELLSFDIKRTLITEQSALSFYLPEHNIYYLSLTIFSENALSQIKNLLEIVAKNKYKGLILDLRNNSGGLLNAAVDVASLFVDKNSLVVITKDKYNKDIERYHTTTDPVANNDLPIFIMTNNYTASAAEILAGALKIHSQEHAAQQSSNHKQKLAVFLVGTKTFGKGSVQEIIPVNNNCAVKLTTSLYYLPNNTTVQGQGIEPDFVIEKTFPPTKQMTWFNLNYGREQAFENHIQVNKKTEQKDTSKENDEKNMTSEQRRVNRAIKMLQTDNQLRSTVSLINLLNTAYSLCPNQVCNREKAVTFLKSNHLPHDILQIQEVKA